MKILLATLHAKYVHASLALPSLAAACGELPGVETVIHEFTVHEPHDQLLRRIAAEEAEVVAFSCYIWNVQATLRLASDLKKLSPRTFIVLGGPEVSYGAFELMEQHPEISGIVRGEGEDTFRALAAALNSDDDWVAALNQVEEGLTFRAGDEVIALPDRPEAALDTLPSPFAAGLVDLKKPLVYYESSRGCPFSCAFCMSSMEKGVRSYAMGRIERDLALLLGGGVKTIKFVDRTFNYDAGRADRIWRFIMEHNRGSVCHFEIAADLLTEENLKLLTSVPQGMFRFEIGVQSAVTATLDRVGRKSDLERLFANVRRLVEETGVTVHLDLVAGLPHEDMTGFLGSLERLMEAAPHHVQVEPLKVLKGTPMRKIAREEGYAFSDTPPYKILRTPWLSYQEISRIETIARLLDLTYNSGRFQASLRVLAATAHLSQVLAEAARFWETEEVPTTLSQTALFEAFWRFGRQFLSPSRADDFREALCFDFCLAEYPVAGKLPLFFAAEAGHLSVQADRPRIDAALRALDLPRNSRVRTFVQRFSRDYRSQPAGNGPLELLFVYVSAPGRGLSVTATPLAP